MSTSAFTPSVLTVPSSAGGSGQGELNLVTNPSAAGSSTTGWLATSATLGTGSSGGPLNPTVSTYFTIINTIGSPTESSTSGAYSVLTLPSGMQNRKLKVEFYFTSPATDTFKVSVYKGSTRVPLSTDSAGSTSLPQSTTGKFTAYFDTDSSGTWTVSITKTSGPGSTPLQFTNVVVGPGIQPQGAVVGEWTAFTPTWSNVTLGTGSTSTGQYRRVGSSMEIAASFTLGTGGSVSGIITFTMPALTIDTARLASGSIGSARAFNSTPNIRYSGIPIAVTSTTINFIGPSTGNVWQPSSPGTWAATDILSFTAAVPIAEWAGSGTVQLAQNDVEYASNSDTSNANDTTSFVYGPSGSSFPSSALTAARGKRVRFQTPIQAGDRLDIEVNYGDGKWYSLIGNEYGTGLQSLTYQNGVTYGVGIDKTSIDTNSITVYLGQYYYANSTYGAVGTAWSATSGGWKWRVRKSSAGAAVGFGIHQPGVSSGLVSASGLVGRTDGLAVPTGYVGEKIDFTARTITATTGSWTANTSALTSALSPGKYMIYWSFIATAATSATYAEATISTNSSNDASGALGTLASMTTSGLTTSTWGAAGVPYYYENNTSGNVSLYAKAASTGASRNIQVTGFAIRIA